MKMFVRANSEINSETMCSLNGKLSVCVCVICAASSVVFVAKTMYFFGENDKFFHFFFFVIFAKEFLGKMTDFCFWSSSPKSVIFTNVYIVY